MGQQYHHRKREFIMMCGIVDLGSNTIRLSIYQYEGSISGCS